MSNYETLTPITGKYFRQLLRDNYGDDSHIQERFVITDDLDLVEMENIKAIHSLVRVNGTLNVNNAYIKSFPNLEYAESLMAWESHIIEFPKLENVGKDFWADNSTIAHLPLLRTVGNDFQLNGTEIVSLPSLVSVSLLNINNSKIEHLPALKKLDALEADNSIIRTIPELEFIDGYCNTRNAMLESMPKLTTIVYDFKYEGTNIRDIEKLTSVNGKPFKLTPSS